jgi:hypothetical protein
MAGTGNQRAMPTLRKKLSGESLDCATSAAHLLMTSPVLRTLLAYLAVRAGRLPRGPIGDVDLGALKSFVNEHPDLSERCGVTEDEMGVLRKAVEGV